MLRVEANKYIHSVAKVYAVFPFYDVKCLGMFWRAGMRKGGKPLPLAFQYLIFMVKRPCDLNLVMISSLASKCQDFKVEMSFFQPL